MVQYKVVWSQLRVRVISPICEHLSESSSEKDCCLVNGLIPEISVQIM